MQIVVQGLPWAHTSEDLQPMFEPYGTIEHCEVVYGRDNRSRVRATLHKWHLIDELCAEACQFMLAHPREERLKDKSGIDHLTYSL